MKKKDKWREITLGDMFRIKHGYAFKSDFFSDSGSYIVLTPGNFYEEGGFKLKGNKDKYYVGKIPSGFILNKSDLIVAMTEQAEGLLGSPAIVPASNLYLHNQRLGLITDLNKSQLDKFFLYYLFNSRNIRTQIRASANGTKVRHTSPDRIYQAKVKIPELSTQKKIAAILSAYDDLIENNTRRIKILEEMAQTLYHEWFVKFRFPGHEHTKMIDSELGLIPEGWEVRQLGLVADINSSSIKPGNVPESINYIDISSVNTGQINKIETIAFAEASSRARRVVKHGDIIWSTVRPNRRSYSLILNPIQNLIVSTGFAVITARKIPYTYLYHALTTDNFVDYLTNNATGSAYPAVNTADFKNAELIIPPHELLNQFHKFCADILSQKQNFHSKNLNLRKTRDLLLPKLISGEIDVEHLEITTEDIAA